MPFSRPLPHKIVIAARSGSAALF